MNSLKASFSEMVFENGYIWTFDKQIQAICRIDTDNFEMEVISFYKGKEKFYARKIFIYQDKFYLVERRTVNILVFDRNAQKNSFVIYAQKSYTEGHLERYTAFFYKNCICFISQHISGEMICFNILTKDYSTKMVCGAGLKKEKIGYDDLRCLYPYYYKENVWFACNDTKYYGRFDLDREKLDLFQIEDDSVGLNSCCFDGEKIWLTENCNNHVICVGERVLQISEDLTNSTFFPINEGIFILLENSSKLIFIEKETFNIFIVKFPFDESEKQDRILWCYEYNDFVFFLLMIGDLFVLDKRIWKIQRVKLKCKEYIGKCCDAGNVVVCESKCINLYQLLEFCNQHSGLMCNQKMAGHEVGNSIWKAI